jgi:hypothetical protein
VIGFAHEHMFARSPDGEVRPPGLEPGPPE